MRDTGGPVKAQPGQQGATWYVEPGHCGHVPAPRPAQLQKGRGHTLHFREHCPQDQGCRPCPQLSRGSRDHAAMGQVRGWATRGRAHPTQPFSWTPLGGFRGAEGP